MFYGIASHRISSHLISSHLLSSPLLLSEKTFGPRSSLCFNSTPPKKCRTFPSEKCPPEAGREKKVFCQEQAALYWESMDRSSDERILMVGGREGAVGGGFDGGWGGGRAVCADWRIARVLPRPSSSLLHRPVSPPPPLPPTHPPTPPNLRSLGLCTRHGEALRTSGRWSS